MPGIAGFVGTSADPNLLPRMLVRLQHQPWYSRDSWTDATQSVALGRVSLGYINTAPQPAVNEDGSKRAVITFGGGSFGICGLHPSQQRQAIATASFFIGKSSLQWNGRPRLHTKLQTCGCQLRKCLTDYLHRANNHQVGVFFDELLLLRINKIVVDQIVTQTRAAVIV